MAVSFYQWHVKSKRSSQEEERQRLEDDVEHYHQKWRESEDEIDELKDEIRALKEKKQK